MNTEHIDRLKAARNLILDPEHWTQGEYARDKFGTVVRYYSDDACKWCLVGAIHKVEDTSNSHNNIYDIIWNFRKGQGSLSMFNDTHSHAQVIELLDNVIKEEEAKLNASTT